MMPRRLSLPPTRCLPWLLAAALPMAALASDPHAAPAADTARVANVDPMAHLKARLLEKLGATRIEEAKAGTHELQVPARAPAPASSTFMRR